MLTMLINSLFSLTFILQLAGANLLMTLMFVNWAAVATLNKPRDQIYWRKI